MSLKKVTIGIQATYTLVLDNTGLSPDKLLKKAELARSEIDLDAVTDSFIEDIQPFDQADPNAAPAPLSTTDWSKYLHAVAEKIANHPEPAKTLPSPEQIAAAYQVLETLFALRHEGYLVRSKDGDWRSQAKVLETIIQTGGGSKHVTSAIRKLISKTPGG